MSAILSILVLTLALVHNILLITMFILRKRVVDDDYSRLNRVGIPYSLSTVILSMSCLILSYVLGEDYRTLGFLWVFIGYIGFEILLEYIMKIDFRNNWKLLVPYLVLYYMANYSAVMLVWDRNVPFGVVILVLFICQIVVNAWSHKKIDIKKKDAKNLASKT